MQEHHLWIVLWTGPVLQRAAVRALGQLERSQPPVMLAAAGTDAFGASYPFKYNLKTLACAFCQRVGAARVQLHCHTVLVMSTVRPEFFQFSPVPYHEKKGEGCKTCDRNTH